MKQMVLFLFIFLSNCLYSLHASSEQVIAENLIGKLNEENVNELNLPSLIRERRAAIILNFFYHPPNPYSCYTVKSPLFCTSKTFSLQVQSTNTIRMLKQIVETEEKYPANLQIMKLGNRVLDDSQTIASYDIQNNYLIDLTLSKAP